MLTAAARSQLNLVQLACNTAQSPGAEGDNEPMRCEGRAKMRLVSTGEQHDPKGALCTWPPMSHLCCASEQVLHHELQRMPEHC